MKLYPRFGVFLNESPADETVLAHAKLATQISEPEHIHCIHFREKGVADERPDPSLDEFRTRVLAVLGDELANKVTCEVIPEYGVRAILRSIRDNNLNGAIVGRRLPTAQMAAGSTFKRLASKAPCHILVVTQYSVPHFDRLLVPIDFSEHSKLAVGIATGILGGVEKSRRQMILHHNVEVGYGYTYSGSTFEQYAKSLVSHAEKLMAEFKAEIDFGDINPEHIITVSDVPHEAVTELAVAHKMDVVIVGSRGKGSVFGALLGGNAERILMNCPLPVLIAKHRGEALKLLDLILKEEAT